MSSPLIHAARDAVAAITSSLPAPTTTALAVAAAASTNTPDDDDDYTGECRLLGSFALFVQGALGALALLSLVYKRWRERPQRPLKIWFFDVSKQVFGSVLVHGANIFMSMLTSGRFTIATEPPGVGPMERMLLFPRDGGDDDGAYRPNPCSFYLLNLGIDTTLGIPILLFIVRICTSLASRTSFGQPPESIVSGNYGRPPNWRWWLKQSLIYFVGLFGMKLVVLVMFYVFPWLSHVGDWALRWTEGNEKLQIFFVMMLFPLIMNAMQYYIIDSFIKQQIVLDHELIPGEEPADFVIDDDDDDDDDRRAEREQGARRSHSSGHYGGDNFDASSDDLGTEGTDDMRLHRPKRTGGGGYDSDVDGDAPTVIGSSSSSRAHERGTLLPKDLYPKE